MGCYRIKIFDRENPEATPILEHASKSGVSLTYNGSSDKEKALIGSFLAFDMLDTGNTEGKYFHLYTGSETRFTVHLYTLQQQDDQIKEVLFWSGFLLPEQYSEPYRNGAIKIRFTASCGLGRLKGQHIDDDYYSRTFSVVEFITACLRKTGSKGDIFISPAITPSQVARFDQLYLSGTSFIKDNKKQDAHTILNTIVKDLQCSLYSEWGSWFMMGINQRGAKRLSYHRFDTMGNYIRYQTITRKPIEANKKALATPQIKVISPLSSIEVTHKKHLVEIEKQVFTEENDGWIAPNRPLNITYHPRNLLYHNFQGTPWAFVKPETYKIWLYGFTTTETDDYLYIKDRPFVTEGLKFRLSLNLQLERKDTIDEPVSDAELISKGLYNGLTEIALVVLDPKTFEPLQYTAFSINFNEDKEAIIAQDVVIESNGYLELRIYRPRGDNNFNGSHTDIAALKVEEITLNPIDNKEEETYILEGDAAYSIEKKIKLNLSDDIVAPHSVFLLEKPQLGLQNPLYFHRVAIASTFVFENTAYFTVDTYQIFLIKDHPDNIVITRNQNGRVYRLPVLEVIYNFNNGELNAVRYDEKALGFRVSDKDTLQVYIIAPVYTKSDRKEAQSWIDTRLPDTPNRIRNVVASLYKNLYHHPHIAMQMNLQGVYGYSSLLRFNYRGNKTLYPSKLQIDLANGKTTGTYFEDTYGDQNGLLPIRVDVGEDIYLNPDQLETQVTAKVTTPSSFITNVKWEVLYGEVAFTHPNRLRTGLYYLQNDNRIKITVTDNYGQTASDTIRVVRPKKHVPVWYTQKDEVFGQSFDRKRSHQIEFRLLPSVREDVVRLTLNLQAIFERRLAGQGNTQFIVYKNNVAILDKSYEQPLAATTTLSQTRFSDSFSITLLAGDTLLLASHITAKHTGLAKENFAKTILRASLNNFVFQNRTGVVLPKSHLIQIGIQTSG